jgi:hypothetical protein
MTRYEQSPKGEKTEIAKQVVLAIMNTGGRFLKQAEEGWAEVATDIAREKVSHSFRNRRGAGK